MQERDPLIGRQLGAYLIQTKLGEGGMARVYKAYHARLRRDVAIKVILRQIADQADFQARFEREAQVIASLQHPNIVAVYDFGDLDSLTYLVMQYVGGGTLRDRLQGSPLAPPLAVHYAVQMARALHHAHLRGIVHRDVKPQNMLISSSDPQQLLLSDFGIAKFFAAPPDITWTTGANTQPVSDPSLTSIDQIIGTADYMAPEQINHQQIDARTDVYALGVVLYHMLTGYVPFTSTTVIGLMYQHVHTPPVPVRERNPNVPEPLAQITAQALEKAPSARFQSAEAMAEALETVVQGQSQQLSTTANTLATASYTTAAPQPQLGYLSPASYGHSAAPLASTGQQAMSNPMQPAAGIAAIPLYPRKKPSSRFHIQAIVMAAIILLALSLVVIRQFPLTGMGSLSSTTSPDLYTTSFTETFQNNDRGWSQSSSGLQASIEKQQYKLAVQDSNTHFLYPQSSGTTRGPLPANFRLTATIARNNGSNQALYGLAFRLRNENSNVYCYGFVIDSQRNYAVLKYDPALPQKYTTLVSASFPGIQTDPNKNNTLQVSVKDHTFSFIINGQAVPIPNPDNHTLQDTSYTGGQLGLLVSGPASFTVTKVELYL